MSGKYDEIASSSAAKADDDLPILEASVTEPVPLSLDDYYDLLVQAQALELDDELKFNPTADRQLNWPTEQAEDEPSVSLDDSTSEASKSVDVEADADKDDDDLALSAANKTMLMATKAVCDRLRCHIIKYISAQGHVLVDEGDQRRLMDYGNEVETSEAHLGDAVAAALELLTQLADRVKQVRGLILEFVLSVHPLNGAIIFPVPTTVSPSAEDQLLSPESSSLNLMSFMTTIRRLLADVRALDDQLYLDCCQKLGIDASLRDSVQTSELVTRPIADTDAFSLANLQPGFDEALERICQDIEVWCRQCGSSTPEVPFDKTTLEQLSDAAVPAGKTRRLVQTFIGAIETVNNQLNDQAPLRRRFYTTFHKVYHDLSLDDRVAMMAVCFDSVALSELVAQKQIDAGSKKPFSTGLSALCNQLLTSACGGDNTTQEQQRADLAGSLCWYLMMSPKYSSLKLFHICFENSMVTPNLIKILRMMPPILDLKRQPGSSLTVLLSSVETLFSRQLDDDHYDESKADRFDKLVVALCRSKTVKLPGVKAKSSAEMVAAADPAIVLATPSQSTSDSLVRDVLHVIEPAILDVNVVLHHLLLPLLTNVDSTSRTLPPDMALRLISRLLSSQKVPVNWYCLLGGQFDNPGSDDNIESQMNVVELIVMLCTLHNHYQRHLHTLLDSGEPAYYAQLGRIVNLQQLCVRTVKSICTRVSLDGQRLDTVAAEWLMHKLKERAWAVNYVVIGYLTGSYRDNNTDADGKKADRQVGVMPLGCKPLTTMPMCIVALLPSDQQCEHLKHPCTRSSTQHSPQQCTLMSLFELTFVDENAAAQIVEAIPQLPHKRQELWSQLVQVLRSLLVRQPIGSWHAALAVLKLLTNKYDIPKRDSMVFCAEASRIVFAAFEDCKPVLLIGDAVLTHLLVTKQHSPTEWHEQPSVRHTLECYCQLAKQHADYATTGIDKNAGPMGVNQPIYASSTLSQVFCHACSIAAVWNSADERTHKLKLLSVLQLLLVNLAQQQDKVVQCMLRSPVLAKSNTNQTVSGSGKSDLVDGHVQHQLNQTPSSNIGIGGRIPIAITKRDSDDVKNRSATSTYDLLLGASEKQETVPELNMHGFGTTTTTAAGFEVVADRSADDARAYGQTAMARSGSHMGSRGTWAQQHVPMNPIIMPSQDVRHQYGINKSSPAVSHGRHDYPPNRRQRNVGMTQPGRRYANSSNSTSPSDGRRSSISPPSTSWHHTRLTNMSERELNVWERDRALWSGVSNASLDDETRELVDAQLQQPVCEMDSNAEEIMAKVLPPGRVSYASAASKTATSKQQQQYQQQSQTYQSKSGAVYFGQAAGGQGKKTQGGRKKIM